MAAAAVVKPHEDSCEPLRLLQGSCSSPLLLLELLSPLMFTHTNEQQTLASQAFNAPPSHTFCCRLREAGYGQRCQPRL